MKYWVGVQRGQSYSCGEVASLALVGHSPSDGITIKIPYVVDFLLNRPALLLGWLKLNLILLLDQLRLASGDDN